MKKLCIFINLIFTFVLVLSLSACGGSKILSLTAFNTTIRVEAHDKVISSQTQNKLKTLFEELEKEFDADQTDSFVYKLNNGAVNEKFELSQQGKSVFNMAREYYSFSDGKFNPATYPLTKLWQFDNFSSVVSFVPPTDDKVLELLDKDILNFNDVILDNDQIYKTKQTEIDLGGLVKGFAVDKALEIMLEDGHSAGYVNIGNSSMALLNVKYLNVTHPRVKNQTILTIDTSRLYNATLSSSGDYERFFEYDGQRYSHIINSSTGYPIQTGIASATVIGGTGAFTDAITTALCVCQHSPNDFENSELVAFMKKIIQKYPDSQLYIVYAKDGVKQIVTNQKQGDFTLLDDDYLVKTI